MNFKKILACSGILFSIYVRTLYEQTQISVPPTLISGIPHEESMHHFKESMEVEQQIYLEEAVSHHLFFYFL
jgi:hypothetical protein